MKRRRSGAIAIIPAAVVFDHRLSATAVQVLAAISTYADRNGRCWPAVSTLAERTGMSERHARTCLGMLVEFGHLEIDARPGQSNVYRIPRNHSSGVNHSSGDPGTPVQGGRNPSSGDPGTTVPPNDTKNDTNNEHTDSAHIEFDAFWQLYPSRRPHSNPKKPARVKFEAAVKIGTPPADIIRGAQNYAAYVRQEQTDPRFVAMAQTWLGQERWTEYQAAMPPSEGAYDSDVIH